MANSRIFWVSISLSSSNKREYGDVGGKPELTWWRWDSLCLYTLYVRTARYSHAGTFSYGFRYNESSYHYYEQYIDKVHQDTQKGSKKSSKFCRVQKYQRGTIEAETEETMRRIGTGNIANEVGS